MTPSSDREAVVPGRACPPGARPRPDRSASSQPEATLTGDGPKRVPGPVRRPGDPLPSSPVVRARFRAMPRRDSRPELALRRELYRRGLRYRVDSAPLQGLRRRADVVFPRHRLAVFVDGCFWHRCPVHGTAPRNNAEWWRAKLERTVTRDRGTDAALVQAGWCVVRVWEHEDPVAAADRVVRELEGVRGRPRAFGGP